jgi:hypothetical protein
VITPVVVRNESENLLLVERVSIPVPYLSVYAADGLLWTAELTLCRDAGDGRATLEIGRSAPPEAARARLVSPPRIPAEESSLVRAFGGLLRPFVD